MIGTARSPEAEILKAEAGGGPVSRATAGVR
jgi:hypothetical protein